MRNSMKNLESSLRAFFIFLLLHVFQWVSSITHKISGCPELMLLLSSSPREFSDLRRLTSDLTYL